MRRDGICIESGRLLICGLDENDLDVLTAMRNDRRIYRFEPSFLAELQGSPDEALRSLMSMELDRDRQCILGIYEKLCPGILIGLAELYDYKPTGKVISIGYRIRPEYWGKGIGTECVAAMTGYLRQNTAVGLVTAHVLPANKASSRILIKNGFEHLVTKSEDWGYETPSEAEVYTLDC